MQENSPQEKGSKVLPLTFRNNMQFFVFRHFEATGLVVHGFTTRNGGVGSDPYGSLNTAFHVGDDPENVRANRLNACKALAINPGALVAGKQVHGDNVAVVDGKDMGKGALSYVDALPDTDALVTGTREAPLSSYYADCVPIFLLDPVRKVVALAHAGWKGTVLKIGKKTVNRMRQAFGTDPAKCLAGIGPSIGPCCYEVDDRVIVPLRQEFPCFSDFIEARSPGRWRLNLWEANRRTLLEAGLLPANIETASICTCCHPETFFSYRAQNGTTGRMAALLMLK
ncbi:peptidoglycan editing factor PgeF [Pelotomaculum sp. FP]|uniref:peptidoglycan editing factor PgeF n=1 Tax=Pelotomaculum sp. FP TaxID=261474 RepID=UPI001FAB1220|nr:peptidoglycan editing factor PgeF [Pelotomaculum sp. FP]